MLVLLWWFEHQDASFCPCWTSHIKGLIIIHQVYQYWDIILLGMYFFYNLFISFTSRLSSSCCCQPGNHLYSLIYVELIVSSWCMFLRSIWLYQLPTDFLISTRVPLWFCASISFHLITISCLWIFENFTWLYQHFPDFWLYSVSLIISVGKALSFYILFTLLCHHHQGILSACSPDMVVLIREQQWSRSTTWKAT